MCFHILLNRIFERWPTSNPWWKEVDEGQLRALAAVPSVGVKRAREFLSHIDGAESCATSAKAMLGALRQMALTKTYLTTALGKLDPDQDKRDALNKLVSLVQTPYNKIL